MRVAASGGLAVAGQRATGLTAQQLRAAGAGLSAWPRDGSAHALRLPFALLGTDGGQRLRRDHQLPRDQIVDGNSRCRATANRRFRDEFAQVPGLQCACDARRSLIWRFSRSRRRWMVA
jgi:hypothetical protein